ncbi:MAG: nucleoside hydrolase [Sphingomonadales bacterium]|nr:nucleoside hydrolase [Sphingomonadales bacterium]
MTIDRRRLLRASGQLAFTAAAAIASGGAFAAVGQAFTPVAGPRSRVLLVNDLSGDIDGLFATAHAVLSPSTDLRTIVGTRTTNPAETSAKAVELGREIVRLAGREGKVALVAGSERTLKSFTDPDPTPGAQAIIDEARRTDSKLPLFVTVGGGLTEVATALMLAPDIADKFTLVWIGGGAWPHGEAHEANFGSDPVAARYVFNETTVRIWQVPADVYRTCQVSDTELQAFVAPTGPLGQWLYDHMLAMSARMNGYHVNTGESWTLGDSPLVVLTALNDWVPGPTFRPMVYERTGSSQFDEVIAPLMNADGTFSPRTEGRRIRIYKSIDTRMMFADFYAKLAMNGRR